MALSPSHKWGQIIGGFLEEVFEKKLSKFSKKHKLYLDTQGIRKARKGKKVTWVDTYGNSHDLDFVVERYGTNSKIGEPVAFIESAWRRYTKHSRNKAQEIQGAILPLVATHKNYAPFMGVVLGGLFTGGAISQLESLGFNILYFSYNKIVKAFEKFGLDASFDEKTLAKEFNIKISKWDKFSEKDKLAKYLLKLNKSEVDSFFVELEKCISRYIKSISITILHGEIFSVESVSQAINYVENYSEISKMRSVLKYEISIRYNNTDKIDGTFSNKKETLDFLNSYSSPNPKK